MTDTDWVNFGNVQEILDQTDADIDELHLKHGWLSNEEYITWVKKRWEKLLNGTDVP